MVYQTTRHTELMCSKAQVEQGVDADLGNVQVYSFILSDGSSIAIKKLDKDIHDIDLENKEIYPQLCDDCGKTIAYISGLLALELHNHMNNNTRIVDNTMLLCPECQHKRM